MSKVITAADALQMDDGIPVPAIKGVIKTLYKTTKGQSDKGPWSFQNGELQSGGKTMRFTLKDREDLATSFKGREVYLLSNNGSRGWTGVKIKDEEYQGKTRRILWVTGTAEIVLASEYNSGGQQEPSPEDDGREPAAPAAPAASRPASSPDAVKSDKRIVNETKVFVARRASGMKVCVAAAMSVAKEFQQIHQEPMPLEWVQAICSTLFIAGDKAGQFDDMPVNYTAVQQQQEAPAPRQRAQPQPQPQPVAGDEPLPRDPDDVPF